MAHTLYIPGHSEHVVLLRLRIAGDDIPFYWREPEAAHEMARRHYPAGRVYAVGLDRDGRLMAREHVLGEVLGSDPSMADTAGALIAALLIVCAGPFAVGVASFF